VNSTAFKYSRSKRFKFIQFYDFRLPEFFQDKQVFATGNQIVGIAILCQGEQEIVLWIATNIDY